MCLAVPAQIIEVRGHLALADFGGLQKEIRIDLVDANVGDYVLVHVGFAIQVVDEQEALETRRLFEEFAEAVEDA